MKKVEQMNKLPEFKPLPEVENLRSNYMSAFNHGMNIYEALVYLQGYVQITYNSMDDLINEWNSFEQYVTENIPQIANEKTQEILNQWLSDGTLNELISQNPLWNQKVSKTGDIMSGDLQFQENKGVYGTLHSGDKVNMISHSYTGSDDYTQIGDSESQSVVRSKDRPVWYNGSKNQNLIVEDDLNDINTGIKNLEENAEKSVYWNENGSYDTLQDYGGNHQTKFLKPGDIIDNLTSSSIDKALSANQGKTLKDSIDRFFEYNENQEIDTGLKWVDGRTIYRKYFKIDLSNVSLKGTKDFDATKCEFVFIDECSCMWTTQSYSSGANFYFYPVNYSVGNNTRVSCNVEKSKINVDLSSSFNGWYNIFYVVLLYVKKG